MITAAEQTRNMNCWGVFDIDAWQKETEASRVDLMMSRQMVAMSMLSDVQEMIELGQKEEARKSINRIKCLLTRGNSPYIPKDM